MKDKYKIEKGIPVARQVAGKVVSDPFTVALRAMDVGDSIKADATTHKRATMSVRMSYEGARTDKKFVCRTIHATETEPKHYRVWRVK